MKLLTLVPASTSLAAAVLNTTQMYKLKTKLKGKATGREAYDNLYLYVYNFYTLIDSLTHSLTNFLHSSLSFSFTLRSLNQFLTSAPPSQDYHTGAGLSDAVLTTSPSGGINGFLNATNITTGSPAPSYGNGPTHVSKQLFDLGNDFAWGLVMVPNEQFYTQWQPVEINAGASGDEYTVTGFFFNETGLQWTSSPTGIGGASDEFGGWLVCDWWHGTVQLFFRIAYYGVESTPSSCADVYLIPEYF